MDRMTNWSLSFEQQVAKKMWPTERHGSFLLDVWELADKAAEAGDRPHAIAAIFLYQQLTEEMLHFIDYWCYFEVAMALYPTEYAYSIPDRLMFGQMIDRLKQQQDFVKKAELLQSAQKLNSECRIPAAHKLLRGDTLPKVQKTAQTSQALFQAIIKCFNDIRDHFYARYASLAPRTGIIPAP